jgi:hypothetical protein
MRSVVGWDALDLVHADGIHRVSQVFQPPPHSPPYSAAISR